MYGDRLGRYRLVCRIISVLLILSMGINVMGIILGVRLRSNCVEAAATNEQVEVQKTEVVAQEELDKYYSRKLQMLLTPEELTYVTQRQWEYVLSANGKEFTTNVMYLDGAQNVRIMIAEVAKNQEILPPDLLRQGSVWQSDETIELTDYITVTAPIPYEMTREVQGNSVKYYYEFKDVAPSTVISFQMGYLLKEKLRTKEDIKGNRVEVIVR